MKIFTRFKRITAFALCGVFTGGAFIAPEACAHSAVNYYYDAGGRLTFVNLGGGKSIEYIYDSSSNLLRKTVTVFADTDTDQMNDAWEQQYFGNTSRTGALDFDNDGMSDRDEYLAGTDPTDAQSKLKTTLVKEGGGHYSVEWPTVPGKRYLLQYKDDLNSPTWTNAFDPFVANSTQSSFFDETSDGSAKRFYRLIIVPET
ncbi:MAG TPA: thrombospondin type 3 repeat-containing protein [Verrucomicrobiae bacterium]